MEKAFFTCMLALFLPAMVWGQARASADFQKNYRLAAGKKINIDIASGDIIVNGYDGDEVRVTAYKKGRDRDRIEIQDMSDSDGINLRLRYPENCRCEVSTLFEIQVPRGVSYRFHRLNTASGSVKVSSVRGDIQAQSASGNVVITDASGQIIASTASGNVNISRLVGAANAQAASGNVNVEIVRLEGTSDLIFSSASGDVNVRMPENIDAQVSMSTASGSLKTDFPIQVIKHEYGTGRNAQGRLGNGLRNLRITSSSGSVSLRRIS